MKYLLIAEKPSLKKNIEAVYQKHRSALGLDIDFLAMAGHVMRLKQPKELNPAYGKWEINNYPMQLSYKYTVIEGKQNLFSQIQKALKSGHYDAVIHAGDPDQEGELLVRLVLLACQNKLPVYRFWTNDQTEGAVLAALKDLKPGSDYDGFYQAALLRQHMDYQYGMNLTGVMSLKMGVTTKIGRVKAALVSLIVRREKEIQAFTPHSDYVHAFETLGFTFRGETMYKTEKEAADTLPSSATITEVKDQIVEKKAPKLFKLSTLQAAASSKLHLSPQKTLDLAQSLYQKKVLSYPRTDCEYTSSHTNVIEIIENLGHMLNLQQGSLRNPQLLLQDKTYFNDKAIATEGHTAIIPTGVVPTDLTSEEQKLFELVLRRFVSIFAHPKKVRSVQAKAVASDEQYVCKAEDELDAGFELILDPSYQLKHCSKEKLEKGPAINPVFSVKEVKAKCPSRYTDASLILACDHPDKVEGVSYTIGTPATRANIINDCVKCGYFETKKGQYFALPLAISLYDQLGFVQVFDVKKTADWESNFIKIRNREMDSKTNESDMMKMLYEDIDAIKTASVQKSSGGKTPPLGICPLCGGNIYENQKAFGCGNWKDGCKFTVWKNFMGGTITKKEISDLVAGKAIKKQVTSKAGKTWTQELKYDETNNRLAFVEKR